MLLLNLLNNSDNLNISNLIHTFLKDLNQKLIIKIQKEPLFQDHLTSSPCHQKSVKLEEEQLSVDQYLTKKMTIIIKKSY
jgi:hypothetical protein